MPNNSTDNSNLGQAFNSQTKQLRLQRRQIHQVCYQFNQNPSPENLQKIRHSFGACGKQVFIEAGFHCDYGDKIYLGDRVYFNINCTLLDGGNIYIGDDCLIGPNVQIITINHDLSPEKRLNKTNYAKDITIGKNVWIGAGCIILPGVKIADGSVIGAASLVSRDVEANSLYLGNPARKLKDLC